MKKITFFLILVYFSFSSTTKIWKKGNVEDFLKGTLKGVSLSWDGVLSPSFQMKLLPEIKENYIFSMAKEGEGIYVGTGHRGGLYFIGKDGKAKLIYSAPEPDIFAVAPGENGEVFFATSPKGKIYRYRKGKVEEFFNPDEKFIWKLKYKDKYLYASTGKPSVLYRINDQGAGEKIAELPDSQLLDFVFSELGIILSTSDNGRVYLLKQGKPHLLWESPYREVNSVVYKNGKIYASTQGKKSSGTKSKIKNMVNYLFNIQVTPIIKRTEANYVKGESYIYEIEPSSKKARIYWKNPEKYISSLAVYKGELFASTGEKARIFKIIRKGKADLFEETEAREIRKIYTLKKIYFSTSVPSSIYSIEAMKTENGTYESDVLDSGGQAKFGEINFRGEGIEVETRSGNSPKPDSTWEDWSPPVSSGNKVLSSSSRFLQFRVNFKKSSKMKRISIAYRKFNESPEIESIEIFPPNIVFKSYPKESIKGLPPVMDTKEKGSKLVTLTGKKLFKKGFRTLKWSAMDPDGDSLVYDIYIKTEDGKLINLEKNWKGNYYAFDTTFFPDGEYKIKVVARDLPSNPESEAKKDEHFSERFLIDNTPPEINVTRGTNSLMIKVKDSGSGVKELRYSRDGKTWILLSPVDGICDGKEEEFEVKSDSVFALRAIDRQGNAKTLPLRR